MSNPNWISVCNNAGYTPLQILCKNARIDPCTITLFARIGGPEIFSTMDLMRNTPLHSAIRKETNAEALRALIRAYPDALHIKTIYDDTPLHLACLRRVDAQVLREVALASSHGMEKLLSNSNGRVSPILVRNKAGQIPIGIVAELFQRACRQVPCSFCSETEYVDNAEQKRAFDSLAVLVKILHYGPVQEGAQRQSLVGACVSLHRRGVRLDPVFIGHALRLFPEEAKFADECGNYPLHYEASIPVEKMPLLDGTDVGCCGGGCHHERMGVLRMLMDIFPEAARQRGLDGDFPLCMMIRNGRPWDSTFAFVLRTYPQALHWAEGISTKLVPRILEK